MQEINPKETSRAFAFDMWMSSPMPMVTLTKTFDITHIYKISRRKKVKFNALLCWCIAKAASQIEEFYILPVCGSMYKYDRIAVNVIVNNKKGGINSCDILYTDDLIKYGVNPSSDIISEEEYKEKFIHFKHLFTGVNMYEVYRDLVLKEGCEFEMVFSNNPCDILKYTNTVIACDIHTRELTKNRILKHNENAVVITLDNILNASVDGSGYSPYGLLGSNRSTEEKVKLFPRTGNELVNNIQNILKEKTGKTIEVMVYGDGAFKDPVGKIWELADPVVSPAYTSGLEGSPNEIKLKYFSENKFKDLNGKELDEAMREEIKAKDKELKGSMATQGTTPRRYTDLLGSLCDLTSGSGDKGTPVVLVQRYFTNYSNE